MGFVAIVGYSYSHETGRYGSHLSGRHFKTQRKKKNNQSRNTKNPCLTTNQNYDGAERRMFRIGPWSSGPPTVTWSWSGQNAPFALMRETVSLWSPLETFPARFPQTKLMGKQAGKGARHYCQVVHIPTAFSLKEPWLRGPKDVAFHSKCTQHCPCAPYCSGDKGRDVENRLSRPWQITPFNRWDPECVHPVGSNGTIRTIRERRSSAYEHSGSWG